MGKPILPSRDIHSLTDFRANTAKFVRRVQETGRPLILTQHGRGAAVLMDVTQYEQLVERSELADDIRQAESEIAAGRGVPHARARQEVLKRLKG